MTPLAVSLAMPLLAGQRHVRVSWMPDTTGAPASFFIVTGFALGSSDTIRVRADGAEAHEVTVPLNSLPGNPAFFYVQAGNDAGLSAPSDTVELRLQPQRPELLEFNGLALTPGDTVTLEGTSLELAWRQPLLDLDGALLTSSLFSWKIFADDAPAWGSGVRDSVAVGRDSTLVLGPGLFMLTAIAEIGQIRSSPAFQVFFRVPEGLPEYLIIRYTMEVKK